MQWVEISKWNCNEKSEIEILVKNYGSFENYRQNPTFFSSLEDLT